METPSSTLISHLTADIVKRFNLKKRLGRLITNCQDLLDYGPSKGNPGYSEEQLDELSTGKVAPKGSITQDGFEFTLVTDPTGQRVGLAAGPEARNIITKTLAEAEAIKVLVLI